MRQGCTIEELQAIWARLLKRSFIGPNENFFDLGGTPQLATDLFREIAKNTGRELPSVLIFRVPTVSQMATIFANTGEDPSCPVLLPFRQGGDKPAIFMAHGMGGDASQLFDVARQLRITNPIYLMQEPGIDGLSEPLSRIEDVAERYLGEIKKVQPQGPYLLIGYSFGGLVMMEIARRLRERGDVVGFLAMLDTYPHRTHLSIRQQLPLLGRLAWRRLASHARAFKARGQRQQATSTLDKVRERIHSAESIAWRNYQPCFYQGRVCFVKARVATYYPRNPRAVWGPLSSEFELHTVPGDHTALVSAQSNVVAQLLSAQLRKTDISVMRGTQS